MIAAQTDKRFLFCFPDPSKFTYDDFFSFLNENTVLDINFLLQVASNRYKKVVLSKYWWPCNSQQKNNFSENGHVLPRSYFHNRIPR